MCTSQTIPTGDFPSSIPSAPMTIASVDVANMNIKIAPDLWMQELKKTNNKKENSYILLIRTSLKNEYDLDISFETLIFDNFDACNVTEQVLMKNNAKDIVDIRKYFYKNKKFFEMTEFNGK